ncbi:MAG TPA: TIGR04222 domain-containing membrane protein [Xanthobacteraceae bacterium]|nr:TIGR04222 domain-containing membrane protein [Xanthobacteraceae bacterium]
MDWLNHNVIADLHGPSFLLAYAAIALAIITVAYGIVRSCETDVRGPPLVPLTFDPYEIAYLRGGKNEVIRTVLYALYQGGFVEVIPGTRRQAPRLVRHADGPDTKELTELENRILASIDRPVEVSDLFWRGHLGGDVENLCGQFRRNLESDGLLRSDRVKQVALRIPLLAGGILVALSLYKIAMALSQGLHNVGFLIILTLLSLLLLWLAVGRIATARISDRGRAYLRRLQTAYAGIYEAAAQPMEKAPQLDHASVLLISLFGLGTLRWAPDPEFASLFARGASGSSGGGGCGAGGGCGSGHGSCGGGGGGCGGGGGGGCGGGCGGS